MNALRQWKYVREVIIPAAIKDAETNPNNFWYRAYKDIDWVKVFNDKERKN